MPAIAGGLRVWSNACRPAGPQRSHQTKDTHMIKQLTTLAFAMCLCAGMAQAATPKDAPNMKTADCEKQAAEKKLAGAAKNSFVKKCAGADAMAKPPAAAACDAQAAEKKLAGAAKTSFVKKCNADAK